MKNRHLEVILIVSEENWFVDVVHFSLREGVDESFLELSLHLVKRKLVDLVYRSDGAFLDRLKRTALLLLLSLPFLWHVKLQCNLFRHVFYHALHVMFDDVQLFLKLPRVTLLVLTTLLEDAQFDVVIFFLFLQI